ncbi:MAG: hypothetical protein ACRDP6_48850 [Actinoallomurus sp.]
MNITEANATSRLLSWITGRTSITTDLARADAELLAARANKALHAGITPDHVRANWPSQPPGQQREADQP